MKILEIEHLTVSYEKRPALTDISFQVEEGDYLTIVGENGSGKSTLIKTILGLLQPDSGTIIRNGFRQNEIGYLPQSAQMQKDFPALVSEVVLSGCLNSKGLRPFYRPLHKQAAYENMRLLGIEALAKKSFSELSGGQKQRVLLARALCATKKLLLLDEPVAALDPVVTHEFYAVLETLNRERGITVLMVSHDLHCGAEHSKNILHLQNRVLFFGPVKDYMQTDFCRHMTGGHIHA